mmetsp:Transcript_52245/g.117663  ORF Transcript_52245/g.117663 Transcript_52245/m.117663 type:complete len:562 (+) Transcript_52245:55-1740(+)
MQVPSTVESIPAYIIIALLIVDLCATLRWACWYAWLTKVRSLLAATWAGLRWWHQRSPVQDELQKALNMQMQLWRWQQLCRILTFVKAAITLVAVRVSTSTLLRMPRLLYWWQDVGLLIFYSMVLFMFVFPNQLKKPLRLWLGHSIMMVATLVYMLPSEGTTGCMLITNANVARMAYTVLSLATMQTRTTAVWSILYGVTFFLSTFSPENFCNSTPMIWRLIAGEFAYVLFIIALSGVLENMVKMAMLRDLETHTLHNKHSAENVLLRMIYDVVIELDVDLRLVGPTPQLSGFLLHGTNRSIAGANFVDFIPFEEDRDTFQERITNAKSGLQNVAQVWHMHLCDGDSTAINVEAFSVSFEGFGGRTRHLVGIREFADMPQGGIAAEQSPLPEPSPACRDPEAATAVVDVAQPGCPIIECSVAFTSVVGPVPMHGSLFSYTRNPPELAQWLQKIMAMVFSNLPAHEIEAVNHFRVRLRRHGQGRRYVAAMCKLLLDDDLGDTTLQKENTDEIECYYRIHFSLSCSPEGSTCSSSSSASGRHSRVRRPSVDGGIGISRPSLSL